jgi:peptide-methionine (S)-S-oxide reductase
LNMLNEVKRFIFMLLALTAFSCAGCEEAKTHINKQEKNKMSAEDIKTETATFGSGCFWCTEAIFERVNGVLDVISGYAGGHVNNPTYEEVCNGTTGHAECTQIIFNPDVISYDELLEIFWKTHDPTTLNRQGNDVGTQYRSVIFYHNEDQKQKAEYYKKKLEDEKIWKDPIVTEISPMTKFYAAEKYHQDYYENNPYQGYCSFVITPKVEKFEKVFKDKLKK